VSDDFDCFTSECELKVEYFFLLYFKDGTTKKEYALTAVCGKCARRLRVEEKLCVIDIEDIGRNSFLVAEIFEKYDTVAYDAWPSIAKPTWKKRLKT
jgi:hypothetical protein